MTDEKSVVNAVRLIDRLGTEIEAFKAQLEAALLDRRTGDSFVFATSDEDAEEEAPWLIGDGWAYGGFPWHFPVLRSNKGRAGKSIGYLSILVDIGMPGGVTDALGAPTILIAWGPKNGWWGEFEDYWPFEEGGCAIEGGTLFRWDGGAARPELSSWCFAVRLFDIRNPEDVRGMIERPVKNLLAGQTCEAAFGRAPKLLRFDWNGGVAVLVPQ